MEPPARTAKDVRDDAGAPAELALGEVQLELAPRRALDDETSTEPYVRMAGFAQVTGGGEGGGDLGAGAAVAVPGLGCDFVNAAAQGRLRPLAEERVVGDARYAVCLSRMGFTVEFEGRRGIGLAPALDARRSLWRRRYDLSYDRVTVGGGELGEHAHHHTILLMSIGHGKTRQADGDARREIDQLDFDATIYRHRYERPGFEARVDALAFEVDGIKASGTDLGGVTSSFDPVRVALAGGAWFASARAGWGMTGGQIQASGKTEVDGEEVSSWSETIDGAGLPELRALAGEVAAGARGGGCEATASVGRSFYPTFDGNIALEERASGSLGCALGPRRATKLRVSPFAARTWTWTREAGSSYEVSAGASVHAGHALDRRFRIDAIGEAGVAPYARLDGERDPSARLGGRLMVALSAGASR